MNDQQPPPEPNQPSEQVRAQHVTARVPESVSQGVFSTGVILMTGGSEFVVDFVQNIGGPANVAARVVIPHGVMPQFIEALKKNLELYSQRFGAPPALPKGDPKAKRPSVQEIYDELKIPDEVLAGSYANGLMIGHTASEFKLDFLTNLYPHSAVSCRVFVSAPQVPRMLDSLSSTYQQFAQRVQQQTGQQQTGQQQTGQQQTGQEPTSQQPPSQQPPPTPEPPADPSSGGDEK